MKEYLRFKVEGEFITNLARSWFWEENREYDICAELIGSCIQTEDSLFKNDVIVSILEGRKKFVGINHFQLVDDNTLIRPLTLKLQSKEHKSSIKNIGERHVPAVKLATTELPKRFSKEWWDYKMEYDDDGTHKYRIYPDDIDSWEGLISPTGDFYSCQFGGHNIRAYYLMLAHPEKFGYAVDKDGYPEIHDCGLDNALDNLLSHGWCATRWIASLGHYVDTPKLPKRLTKAQFDTIMDAVLKYDIHDIDTSALR